jgi:signal transduction histidine kinase
MRVLSSLRSRLLLGAVLWTIGLLAASLLIANELFYRHREWPRVMHNSAFDHVHLFLTLSIVSMAGGFLAIRSGLLSLGQLRARLAAVHAGKDRRLEGAHPAEVQPLVNDLNALINHQDQMVRRALAKAGDLAHGLKTPLAVLSQEAERADAAGHPELAATISQQVERMRRQVEYHLAHARAAASGVTPGTRCDVLVSAEGLARTLDRIYAGRGVVIDIKVCPSHVVRTQREDLDEMLGNLLDNACKWAKSRVLVSSATSGDRIVITVDDDGEGLAESMREAVLQRGVRADEAAPGSGFGLAIVRELSELYGGAIRLGASPAGGLRAELELPAGDITSG